MPIVDAEVPTDRASRYLVQLCKHFSNKGRHLGHRPRLHGPGDAPPVTEAEAARMQVEWTDRDGYVDFGFGLVTLQAIPTALILRAQAPDQMGLQRVVDVVDAHLGRYSRRDPLTVRWQREQSPEVPGDESAGGTASGREGVAAWRGGHRRVAVLAGVVVVAVAVHVGLGGWLLASSHWTGTAVGIVLAVVLVKVGAVGLVAARRVRAARGAAK
jgi:hypothetical protein